MKKEPLNKPMYRLGGFGIIAGVAFHALNFGYLVEMGFISLVVANSTALTLCAVGSTYKEKYRLAWFVVKAGLVLVLLSFGTMLWEHLYLNAFIEVVGLILSAYGNKYRLQSFEPRVSATAAH